MGRLGLVRAAPAARPAAARVVRGSWAALALLACLVLVAALAGSARAASAPQPRARAWLLENPLTGAVLASHDVGRRMPIASITKLMTLIVSLGRLDPDQIVRVDPRAAAVGEESIYLTAGEEISVEDLVKGALIQSANDAADALALATAPSFAAFAALMNAKARELGLDDTHFVRPDGLDAPGEYSSARDVTRLALAAMRIPIVRETVDEQTAVIAGGRVLHTWNDLLGVFPGVFGVKTGNTSGAGWCQVVAMRAGGVTLYATILGSPTESRRDADLERLLSYGLAQYREVDAVRPGRDYAEVALPDGRAALGLVAASPLEAAARVGTALTERVVAPLSVRLPVRAGEPIGRVEVYDAGRLVGQRALVASRAVSAPGLAGRIGWYAGRTVHHLVRLLT
jgi:D-alanyl-D-alanine carboxypeptidase (penicillin-binding protein 5/6)